MKHILLALVLMTSGLATAQATFFSPHQPKAADAVGFTQKIIPDQAGYFSVATPADLGKFLQGLPFDDQAVTGEETTLLNVPAPDGTVSTFRLTRYRMISDELQARYPHYVTAFGWDVTAPNRKIFLEWTDLGFGASITGGTEGRWYVSPQFHARQDLYQVYYTRNYPAPNHGETCGFVSDAELAAELEAFGQTTKSVGDCELREYRLALACTGEYYAAVGGTEALVVAEMMTAINRVNEVFRSDLALTMKIINLPVAGGGIELVFDNPVTDPYDNEDGSVMLGQNQAEVDATIGPANYDVGHVFSTGGGGIASLDSPCSSVKAQGVTGLPSPTGDPFYIDFVAHELGHQFGGNHTFNSTEVNCAARNGSTAYEPGGGTTVQAYAGICGATANIQQNSDPYYHAISIQEIATYMELGGGSTCASTLSTANNAPTVGAGADYVIPANTPFVLTATGSDPDGDALTYCWEQFDLGPVVAGEPTGNEADAPLFRSLPPTTSPDRYFPNLPALVAGGSAQWEVLPQVARNMTFIVTLRDFGSAGYGCTVQDEMEVDVAASAGFSVVAPNGGEVWLGGNTETVSWNVAGTGSGTAVNCDMVEIVLSTDGGLTFDQSLGTFPNTGSASVNAPAITETDARIMVRCAGNIFFNVGAADFRIEQSDYSYSVVTGSATACNGQNEADFSFELESLQGYTGTITFSEANLPAGATITYTPAMVTLPANARQRVNFVLGNLSGLAGGTYLFDVTTNDGVSGPKTETFALTVKDAIAAPTAISPSDGGTLSLQAASFNWTSVPDATGYAFDLCTNAAFTSCFSTQFTTNSGINFGSNLSGNFNPGDMAFFRVTALDETCEPAAEAASQIFSFTFVGANSLLVDDPSLNACEGTETDEQYTLTFVDGALTGPATLSVLNQPAGVNAMLSVVNVGNGDMSVLTLSGEETLAPGSYTITVRADDGSNTEDLDLTYVVEADAVVITSPVDGEQVQLSPNSGCTNSDGATFIDFNFDAYTDASVDEYLLYIFTTGGAFNPIMVTPGAANTQGLCVDEGEELTFYIEATLTGGGTVRSCERTIIATENPLPVEWLSFTARPLGKTSQLNWSVMQDEAHRAFTVERSVSGDGAWADVTRVARTGADGPANYAFNDATVSGGQTYFYRLRQEDADGTTDHSVIRSVSFDAAANVSVFPNPVGDLLTVNTVADAANAYQLINPLGQEVRRGKLTAGSTTLDLAGLPTAVYQLVLTGGDNFREVIKVVKR